MRSLESLKDHKVNPLKNFLETFNEGYLIRELICDIFQYTPRFGGESMCVCDLKKKLGKIWYHISL